MESKGMVHALEEAHRLLKPQGRLVDIHPVPESPILEVLHDGRSLLSEVYPSEGVEAYRQADAAIEVVVSSSLFSIEHSATFDFRTHAPSSSALRAHLEMAGAFDRAPPDEGIQVRRANLYNRVDSVVKAAGSKSDVVLRERGQIATLRPRN
jgi:hypothetical protein